MPLRFVDHEWTPATGWIETTPQIEGPGFGNGSFLAGVVYDRARKEMVAVYDDNDAVGGPGSPAVVLGTGSGPRSPTLLRGEDLAWSVGADHGGTRVLSGTRLFLEMAYDQAREEVVSVVGDTGTPETWTRGGSGLWVQEFPVNNPPAFTAAFNGPPKMAYDAAREVVVFLPDGRGSTATVIPVREWNGTNWSIGATGPKYPTLGAYTIAWDGQRNEILYFNFTAYLSGYHWELWGYNGAWTQYFPAVTDLPNTGYPSTDINFFHTPTFIYDEASGQMVSEVETRLPPQPGVTWVRNGSNGDSPWILDGFADPTGTPSFPFSIGSTGCHPLAYDSDRGKVFQPGGYADRIYGITAAIDNRFGLG